MNNNLTKDQKIKLYDFVCEYEEDIKGRFGEYNLTDDNVQTFLRDNGIHLGNYSSSAIKRHRNSHSFLLYDNAKPKTKKLKSIHNDPAHNILRHLRNSIAHGLIVKKTSKAKEVEITDKNKNGNVTMWGRLPYDLLLMLIELLKNSPRCNT